MPEYTLLTVLAVVALVVAERVYFRSGIFRTAQYWWSIVIIFAFQIPVDGWLILVAGRGQQRTLCSALPRRLTSDSPSSVWTPPPA